jgi:hypothetical protein
MSRIINKCQSVFIKGRNIMDGVMILREIVHDVKVRKKDGVILKLDFEKAYDKISWEFLFEMLKQRGFCESWCKWMREVVSSGTLSVKVNGLMGGYFKCGKGVRQGDPLSPLLFNLAADSLAKMIHKAQENNLIEGLVPEYVQKGIAVLQYADDTILCLKDDLEIVQNMKLLLYIYEKMSGLKINFSKNEVLMISHDDQRALQLANVMNCSTGVWPIKYLGVPVAGSRLHVSDWVSLVEKLMKRLEGWQGSALSIGGRITLINACLSSIPTYCMSMYLLPKTIIKEMDSVRKRFFLARGRK